MGLKIRVQGVVEMGAVDEPWATCSKCGGDCWDDSCGMSPCCDKLGPAGTARCEKCGHDEPIQGLTTFQWATCNDMDFCPRCKHPMANHDPETNWCEDNLESDGCDNVCIELEATDD